MGLTPPGTFTHNAVPTKQCEKFLEETEGQGICAMVLVTDGRPMAIDPVGNALMTDQAVMEEMDTNMERFTETQRGKSFVWFLGSVSQWQSVVNAVAELRENKQLSLEQIDAFTEVAAGRFICGTIHREHWDGIPIWAKCPLIDDLTEIGMEERDQIEEFQALMTDPENGRYWVQTDVANTASGTSISGSLVSFLGGLKNLIALLKQETRFEQ
jgi:hypothetical protein